MSPPATLNKRLPYVSRAQITQSIKSGLKVKQRRIKTFKKLQNRRFETIQRAVIVRCRKLARTANHSNRQLWRIIGRRSLESVRTRHSSKKWSHHYFKVVIMGLKNITGLKLKSQLQVVAMVTMARVTIWALMCTRLGLRLTWLSRCLVILMSRKRRLSLDNCTIAIMKVSSKSGGTSKESQFGTCSTHQLQICTLSQKCLIWASTWLQTKIRT